MAASHPYRPDPAAIRGVRAAVDKDHLAFVDLVEELRQRRKADEDSRAQRLGLAKASEPAPPPAGAPAVPKPVVLRVLVPDAARSYGVKGQGYFRPQFSFEQPMFDDGSHGDERGGDGVFSTTVEVPGDIGSIEYKYQQGDVAEFEPLPPLSSALGNRFLQASASGTGPVDHFGESLMMVERAHPNRDGHAVVAGVIAGKLSELPRFAARTGGAGAAVADRN